MSTEPIVRKPAPASKELEIEARIALEGRGLAMGVMQLGPVVPYTCPECHAVMVDLSHGGVPRFRCHTGHAYSINHLLAAVSAYAEDSLWRARGRRRRRAVCAVGEKIEGGAPARRVGPRGALDARRPEPARAQRPLSGLRQRACRACTFDHVRRRGRNAADDAHIALQR
jgi:hypothetical protein